MADLTELQNWIDQVNHETITRAKTEGWSFYTTMMSAEGWYETYQYTTIQQVKDHLDMETFSDWYKELYGFRPSFEHWSVKMARDWMESQRWNEELEKKAKEYANQQAEATKPENYKGVTLGDLLRARLEQD